MAVVGLGKSTTGVCESENWDTRKENIRQAVSGESPTIIYWEALYRELMFYACLCVFLCSAGCRLLQELEVNYIEVDGCGDAQSAAEGAVLSLFHYDQLKSKKKTKVSTQLHRRLVPAGLYSGK